MERRLTATLAVVAALAVALLAAGCGGSDDDQTTEASAPTIRSPSSVEASGPVTKAEFIRKSAALCAKYIKPVQSELDVYLKKEGLEGGGKPTKSQFIEIARLRTYSGQLAIDVYRRVAPPSDKQDKAQVIPVQRALEISLPEATTTLPATSTDAYVRASRLARMHGYRICRLKIR